MVFSSLEAANAAALATLLDKVDESPRALFLHYLSQETVYCSSRKGFMVIAEMNPVYALNAAEKLLRTARQAAPIEVRFPLSWMAAKPLIRALLARAGEPR